MLGWRAPFAIHKPAFWAQENKYEDQNTKDIPLPCIPCVRPKKTLLDNSQNEVHLSCLARHLPPLAIRKPLRVIPGIDSNRQ
jgi:hypothetical protein